VPFEEFRPAYTIRFSSKDQGEPDAAKVIPYVGFTDILLVSAGQTPLLKSLLAELQPLQSILTFVIDGNIKT
jgi:hypothetical protein